jgi:hypothetical protein
VVTRGRVNDRTIGEGGSEGMGQRGDEGGRNVEGWPASVETRYAYPGTEDGFRHKTRRGRDSYSKAGSENRGSESENAKNQIKSGPGRVMLASSKTTSICWTVDVGSDSRKPAVNMAWKKPCEST